MKQKNLQMQKITYREKLDHLTNGIKTETIDKILEKKKNKNT